MIKHGKMRHGFSQFYERLLGGMHLLIRKLHHSTPADRILQEPIMNILIRRVQNLNESDIIGVDKRHLYQFFTTINQNFVKINRLGTESGYSEAIRLHVFY